MTPPPRFDLLRRLIFALVGLFGPVISLRADAPPMRWQSLPAIPDSEGFAAPFVGVSGDALILAGGANIPENKWADVFTKVWYDDVWVLDTPEGSWKKTGKLPRPLGYGVAVTDDDSVLCLGGSDATAHYRDCFRLRLAGGKIETAPLPPLPLPCANACGAVVGRTVYVAGGLESPASTQALHTFWALNLDDKDAKWQALEPWPGPERMLSVAGVIDGGFALCSGVSLAAGADGKAVRTYLRDAYWFKPGAGWKKLADLPRAAVAAPSPAATSEGKLVIVTGDDGANVTFAPVKDHPGFPRDALIFDMAANEWETSPGVPMSRATACTTVWQSLYVVPNGEARPRLRSPAVWAMPVLP